jgi:hypothetical protein
MILEQLARRTCLAQGDKPLTLSLFWTFTLVGKMEIQNNPSKDVPPLLAEEA